MRSPNTLLQDFKEAGGKDWHQWLEILRGCSVNEVFYFLTLSLTTLREQIRVNSAFDRLHKASDERIRVAYGRYGERVGHFPPDIVKLQALLCDVTRFLSRFLLGL